MEVVIGGTQGIPPDSILSIRAGSTRRQGQLATVEKPFKFPNTPEDCSSVKIDVFQHIGTARTVSQAGTSEHKLIFDRVESKGNDAFGANMEIQFQMRPSQDSHTFRPLIDPGKKQRTEATMDLYLEKHNLVNFLQSLLQGLVKDQPGNPYSYIARQFILEAHNIGLREQAAPADALRQEVLGALVKGEQSGDLEKILMQGPQDGSAGGQDIEILSKAIQDLQKQLQQLIAENADLKAIHRRLDPEAFDALREKAKDTLASAAKDGKLARALEEMQQANGGVQQQVKGTLLAGMKDGRLDAALRNVKGVNEDEEAVLKGRLQTMLGGGTQSGDLVKAIAAAEGPAQTPLLQNGSFAAYYQKFPIRVIPPKAWDEIHSAFPAVPRPQAAPTSPSGVNVVDVKALHSELDKLAQDRAALLDQVNSIKLMMDQVASENQQLAGEVLSRPLSASSRQTLEKAESNLAKYGL